MLPDLLFRITAKGAWSKEFGDLDKRIKGIDASLGGVARSANIAALTLGTAAKAFFGGFAVESVLKLGAAAIDVFHQAATGATDFGGVVDKQVLDRAQAVDRYFTEMSEAIKNRFAGAVLAAGSAVYELNEQMKPLSQQDDIGVLVAEIADLTEKQKIFASGAIYADPFHPLAVGAGEYAAKLVEAKARLAELQGQQEVSKRAFDQTTGYFSSPFDVAGPTTPDLTGKLLEQKADDFRAAAAAALEFHDEMVKGGFAAAAGLAGVNNELDQQINALGMTAEQQKIFNLQVQAGVDALSPEGLAIAGKVQELDQYALALEHVNAQADFFKSEASSAIGVLRTDLEQSKTFAEAFGDAWVHVLQDVIQKIEEAAIAAAASKLFGPAVGIGSGIDAVVAGASHLFGFAGGGSFTVGGSGGTDSQVIPLRLTPGEVVNVDRNGGGGDRQVAVSLHVSTEASPYFDSRVEVISAGAASRTFQAAEREKAKAQKMQ